MTTGSCTASGCSTATSPGDAPHAAWRSKPSPSLTNLMHCAAGFGDYNSFLHWWAWPWQIDANWWTWERGTTLVKHTEVPERSRIEMYVTVYTVCFLVFLRIYVEICGCFQLSSYLFQGSMDVYGTLIWSLESKVGPEMARDSGDTCRFPSWGLVNFCSTLLSAFKQVWHPSCTAGLNAGHVLNFNSAHCQPPLLKCEPSQFAPEGGWPDESVGHGSDFSCCMFFRGRWLFSPDFLGTLAAF